MSISNLLSSGANIPNWQATVLQRQQDLQSLASSLKSGDISGAQQAYADLESIASATVSGTSAASASGPLQQDFATLGKDLSAGNLTQARQDFTQMKTDIQTVLWQNGGVFGAHHHGRHGHHGPRVDATSGTDPFRSSDPLSGAQPGLLSQYASASDNSRTASLLSLIG